MSDTTYDHARTRYAEEYKSKWGYDRDRWCSECEDHPPLVPSRTGGFLMFACSNEYGHPIHFVEDHDDPRYCSECRRYGLHLEPDPDDPPFLRNFCSYCGYIWGDGLKPEEAAG